MTVKVAAKALLYNRQSSRGLSGSVYRIVSKQKTKFMTDIRVPMVDYSSNYSQQKLQTLKPGKYLLQVALPNGEVITENFSIKEDEDTEVIITIPHEGPYEWSSLHAMTGKFSHDAKRSENFSKELGANFRSFSNLSAFNADTYSLALLAPEESPGGDIFVAEETLNRLSNLISSNVNVPEATLRLGNLLNIEQASQDGTDYAIFRFGHSGWLAYDGEDTSDFATGPGGNIKRHYLVQQSKQGVQLICLPTPWATPDGQAEVELLVKKHSLDTELEYSMTISDPMVNSALGYINMGAIHLAQRLIDVELAKKMLFQKMSYPLAATIGGYILVLGRNSKDYSSQADTWMNWVDNLDNWFDWLPDGAILHATMLLMSKKADNAQAYEARAYEALMRAYKRGLPYFTFGLKYLLDGLRYFANKDKEAERLLRQLQPIAIQADPSVPFLSITCAKHWEKNQQLERFFNQADVQLVTP